MLNICRTLTLAYSWAVILSFISRVIAFLVLPETRDTDGCFVHMMGCRNTEHNIQKMLATQYTVEDRLFILWLYGWLGAVPHCCCPKGSILYHISLAWERSKFKLRFLPNAYCFFTIVKSKNCRSNHCKSGTVCITVFTSNCDWVGLEKNGLTSVEKPKNPVARF